MSTQVCARAMTSERVIFGPTASVEATPSAVERWVLIGVLGPWPAPPLSLSTTLTDGVGSVDPVGWALAGPAPRARADSPAAMRTEVARVAERK
ncbi:hypothetical protein [Kitasatospora sp. SUK 42]|uniref:hypothetical protein n=1 Tax=Kitasatospora sp. SUK 42 TaxID=1588882 RepID=UPI001C312FF9|nr:hypothetical protein [Kitasatospora sp. SUK 42]MBV2153160.1 hypothetical protein [Kitasatospora sp. SUK 42]